VQGAIGGLVPFFKGRDKMTVIPARPGRKVSRDNDV